MDKYNVTAGVMSVSPPSALFLPPAEGVAMARRLNDLGAKVARENPGRFGNFATLPMQDVDATMKEITYLPR